MNGITVKELVQQNKGFSVLPSGIATVGRLTQFERCLARVRPLQIFSQADQYCGVCSDLVFRFTTKQSLPERTPVHISRGAAVDTPLLTMRI